MTIFLNGEAREFGAGKSVSELLDAYLLPKQRVAIELNRKVIRRQDWETTEVNDQDKLEVVHFVGGG